MRIQVFGARSDSAQLVANVEKTVAALGLTVRVERVEDPREIERLGVVVTPALAVDGRFRAVGNAITREVLMRLLNS